MGEIDQSAWRWILANSWWIGRILAGLAVTLILFILWMFWRNHELAEAKYPPLDAAAMALPGSFVAMWMQQPQARSEEHAMSAEISAEPSAPAAR